MKTLKYSRDKSLTVATSWQELNAKQFIAIAKVLHASMDQSIASDRVLKILSVKSLLRFLMISLDIRMRCWQHVQWVFDTEPGTEQLLPVFNGYYGPESGFDNLLMVEFNSTEIAYQNWVQQNDADALNELVAVLYREPKKKYNKKRNPDGDVRVAFAFGDIAWHKKKVAKWPMEVKQAIVLWYDACRQQLTEENAEAFEGSGKDDNYYQGLFGMIRSIAAGSKHGNFNQVEQMPVHKAFLEIISTIKELAELEKNTPKS